MDQKTKPRTGFLSTITLILVVACILLVMAYQVSQVASLLDVEPTPTRVVPSYGGGSGVEVEQEDSVPTPTPASEMLAPG